MIRAILWWNRGLCSSTSIYLTAEETRRLSTISHCLKWDPLPPSDVGSISQYVTKREEKEEGKVIFNWGEVLEIGRVTRARRISSLPLLLFHFPFPNPQVKVALEDLLPMEPWAADKKKKCLVSLAVPHQLLSWFLAKGQLPRMSHQSRRSLMITMIMKWSWRLCTDLLAPYSWGKP